MGKPLRHGKTKTSYWTWELLAAPEFEARVNGERVFQREHLGNRANKQGVRYMR